MSVARSLRILPEAEAELAAAAEWYEKNRPGLGDQFVSAMSKAVAAIRELPEAGPVWREGYPYRRYVVRRFPYVVFYTVTDDAIDVYAFAHSKRRPGYWLERG